MKLNPATPCLAFLLTLVLALCPQPVAAATYAYIPDSASSNGEGH